MMPMHKKRHHKRHAEQYTVDNPKREARLQHSTRLVHIHTERRVIYAQGGDVNGVARSPDAAGAGDASGGVGAVLGSDAAELVDAGDEGADEGKVDEGDEEGGAAGRVVAEEGGDDPGGGEDGYDEEDAGCGGLILAAVHVRVEGGCRMASLQNIVRCKSVGIDVAVHEIRLCIQSATADSQMLGLDAHQHAQGWDQGDDFEEPVEDEDKTGNHVG